MTHNPTETEMTPGGGAEPPVEMVAGFAVRLDLAYDPASRTWLQRLDDGRVRVGIEPLEVEASGTVAAISLRPQGSPLRAGEEMGSLEAEKFVGPLNSPVSGTVDAVNQQVLAHPSEVDRAPYEAWLVEIVPDAGGWEAAALVEGPDAVRAWYQSAVHEYRQKGVLAE